MHCRQCRKCLNRSEGIKCDECESVYHIQCTGNKMKDLKLESGDKGYRWICARCKTPASKTSVELSDPQALLNSINAITDKFELINKIQLPKLNNDLLHLKCVTERISKQNDEILAKIKMLNIRRSKDPVRSSPGSHVRRRNLNISPRSNFMEEKTPILGAEKSATYRTRRRSYSLLKMFLQFNRKLNHRRIHRSN
ncbi:unnamed protein product, partial [Brenthis ino]